MGKIVGDAPYLERYTPGYDFTSAWESPASFAKHIAGIDKSKCWHDAGWDKGEWSGSKNMEESLEMVRTGWPKGAETVSRIRDRVLARNPFRKQAIKYGIAGSLPNVPRAVSGNPLSMRADDQGVNKRRPVITLVCNMSANCGVSADAISNRAAALAAIIDQIESKGYSVEVISTATSHGYGFEVEGENFKCVTTIVVKQSHQPVDIGRLAFGLGQASMFRRLVFADWGIAPECHPLGRGLGHSGKDAVMDSNSSHLVYKVPSAERISKYFSDEKLTSTVGVAYYIEDLRKQGCPAFKDHPVTEFKIDKENP